MEQIAHYNAVDFQKYYYSRHPGDYTLKCENNILYYLGEDIFISGNYGIKQNECFNLGYFRIGLLSMNTFNLKPYEIYFLLRETVTSIYNVVNIDDELKYINDLIYLDENTFESKGYRNVISNFIDKYNALKKYEKYLEFNLKDNFTKMSNWISQLKFSNTPGYLLLYNKLFENVKLNDQSNYSNGGNGIARARKGPGGIVNVPLPSDIPSDNFEDYFKKAGITNLLTIIFIIIVTIAIVLTLFFL